MRSPDWIYRDQGAGRLAVLLPGWATDGRVFAGLRLQYDALLPRGMATGDVEGLAGVLRELDRGAALILGWSLGGFAGAKFARQHPELVDRLVLVGVRRAYPREQIEAMRRALREDRDQCLTDFYRRCFLPAQKADFRRFRAGLQPAYLRELRREELRDSLDCLASAELTPHCLPPCPVTIVHGERDGIAPVAEARWLAEESGRPLHVLPNAAHAAFMVGEFLPILHHA